MKERLVQLLDLEQLTPSKFADIIGVQRSSVSHVISGRNNPSFDFLQKTLKAFPGLNAEWLMLGKGTMYEQMGRGVSGTLFDLPGTQSLQGDPEPVSQPGLPPDQGTPVDPAGQAIPESPTRADLSSEVSENQTDRPKEQERKEVVQVMVFFDDDTFRSFRPSS